MDAIHDASGCDSSIFQATDYIRSKCHQQYLQEYRQRCPKQMQHTDPFDDQAVTAGSYAASFKAMATLQEKLNPKGASDSFENSEIDVLSSVSDDQMMAKCLQINHLMKVLTDQKIFGGYQE
jgi:hypothetical protein